MTADPTITDLRRELHKAEDALSACLLYLSRHAQGNAALHCAERVMYSPLHAKVEATITGIVHALKRTEPTSEAKEPEHVHDFRAFASDMGWVRCTYMGCTAKPTEETTR